MISSFSKDQGYWLPAKPESTVRACGGPSCLWDVICYLPHSLCSPWYLPQPQVQQSLCFVNMCRGSHRHWAELETWPWASTFCSFDPTVFPDQASSFYPPYLKARSMGGKEIHHPLNLLCFMIALEFYNPDKPSMDTLDQLFSLSCLAKSMTALPSWDGQQLPGLRATSTSPAFLRAARTTHPGWQPTAPDVEALPTAG